MIVRSICLALGVAAGVLAAAEAADAHPHVWVTIRGEIVFAADGAVVGVRHAWTFDDMYSTFLLEGLEQEQKGVYTREELAPLAEVNVTSLKDYGYFTHAKAGGKKTAFTDPTDYWLSYDDSMLTLHFTLPFKSAVRTQDLELEVYDPEFMVAFELDNNDPVKLVGAPPQCKLSTMRPQDLTPAQSLKLGEAFFSQPSANNFGAQFANKISVHCE